MGVLIGCSNEDIIYGIDVSSASVVASDAGPASLGSFVARGHVVPVRPYREHWIA